MSRDRFGREARERSRDRSREKDYDRDSYSRDRESRMSSGGANNSRLTGHTNSNDPKSLMSRVFIGNLPYEQVTREEILEQFTKYGRVLAVNILKGFGFVQYDTEDSARKAVAMESGCTVKGSKLDIKMAADGRKEKKPWTQNNQGGPPGRRSPFRERSPLRDRATYERTPPRADPYSDPYTARPPPHRDTYDAYRREPYSDHYRDGRDLYSAARPAPLPSKKPPPVDCEITVLSRAQREYADMIDQRLKAFGVLTFVNVLPSDDLLAKAQDDIGKRGIPFNIVVSSVNEQHRSMTLRILHGTPQEHRNMPLDDALNLVNRNFRTYMENYREKIAGTVSTPTVTPAAPAAPTGGGGNEDFIPPNHDTAYLLNLLADNRFLTLEELNKVIRYLNDRRDRLAVKQGVVLPKPAETTAKQDEASLAKQQQELQAKILSVLGNNDPSSIASPSEQQSQSQSALQQLSSSYGAVTSVADAASANLLGSNSFLSGVSNGANLPNSAAAGLNFNNPGIQQALDTLISSSGSILQNLSQGVSLPSQTTPATSQAGLYQNYGAFTGFQ